MVKRFLIESEFFGIILIKRVYNSFLLSPSEPVLDSEGPFLYYKKVLLSLLFLSQYSLKRVRMFNKTLFIDLD